VYVVLQDKIFQIPKVERDAPARGSEVALAQSLASQGGCRSGNGACCIHEGATTSRKIRSVGCGGSRDIEASDARGWLEGMRKHEFVDDKNAIIWSANPAVRLTNWAFKKLLVVAGTPVPDSAHTPSGDEGNPNELGRVESSYVASSSRTPAVAGPARCYAAERTGCTNMAGRTQRTAEQVLPAGVGASIGGEHPRQGGPTVAVVNMALLRGSHRGIGFNIASTEAVAACVAGVCQCHINSSGMCDGYQCLPDASDDVDPGSYSTPY
jgi:hypothetical protein